MIAVSKALPLVKRFGSLPGWPRDTPEAITALAEALATADTEDHARRAVTALEDSERCPTPADLRRAVNATREGARAVGCPRCTDGWRMEWLLRTRERGQFWSVARVEPEHVDVLRQQIDWVDQILYSGAVPCECRKGADFR